MEHCGQVYVIVMMEEIGKDMYSSYLKECDKDEETGRA